MILHVIDNLFAERGGPTTVAIEFARQQARLGRKVAMLSGKPMASAEQRTALERRWDGLGIEFIELGAPGAASALEVVERVKPEVIHIHCVWDSVLRKSAAVARMRGIPYVVSTHGMLHPYALAQKRLKKWVYLQVFPWILGNAAEIYSLNREEADYVARRFGRPSSVLANGIEVAEYDHPENGIFRAKVPALGSRPFVLFVGRLHPIKGIDNLVRSFHHARTRGLKLDLVLVGPDEGARPGLESLVRELGIEHHVHFTGGLFGPEKRDAFAACSIFAHRPRFEGFGITVVEGLASAKPVVTTRECKLDGAVEAQAIHQCDDTDEAFGDALLAVASSPDRGAALGARGQAWVRESFDWPALVERVDASYARARGA